MGAPGVTVTTDQTGAMAYPLQPLPEQFCNLGRLVDSLTARDLDGIVVTSPYNTFYLSGFKGSQAGFPSPSPAQSRVTVNSGQRVE